MAAPRNRKHIIVPGKPTAEPYTPHGRKIEIPKPPAPASRPAHGKALKQAIESALVDAHQRRTDAGFQVHGAEPGLYVQFESQPGVPLKLSSLEDARQGIELVAVSHTQTEEAEPRRIERATVFVPEGKETIARIASATTASELRAAWDSMIWHPSGLSPMGALKSKVEQAERARAIALLGWSPETPENGGRCCATMHELLLSLDGR